MFVTGAVTGSAQFGNVEVSSFTGTSVFLTKFSGADSIPITTSISVMDSGSKILTATGPVGKNFTIHTSEDLRQWTPLITLPAMDGRIEFIEHGNLNFSKRFFRISVQ